MIKHNLDVPDLDQLISSIDKNDDGFICYSEFEAAITPVVRFPKTHVCYEGSFEQRETQKLAWLESLHAVLEALSFATINGK